MAKNPDDPHPSDDVEDLDALRHEDLLWESHVSVPRDTPETEMRLPHDNPLVSANIASRRGNYIFTFGVAGSGKSTFQSHLVRYLMTSGKYQTDPIILDRDFVPAKIVNQWLESWEKGQFPERTQLGNPREFGFRVVPHFGVKTPLEFYFFEMSGEDFVTLEPEPGRFPALYHEIELFLNNDDIRFVLVLVCDGDRPQNMDQQFANFIQYLDAAYNQKFRTTAPVFLLITKPEAAVRRLRQRSPEAQQITLDTQVFTRTFLPATFSRLVKWPAGFAVASYSIGDIRNRADGTPYIATPKFDDTETVFSWIYTKFTGRKLGPRWYERIFSWFEDFLG